MAQHNSNAWSVAVGLAAFLTYLWLAPSVAGDGDSSELTLALARNGVAHPPGYPLYVLFGHLFVASLHEAGVTWAFAANAWSACGAALAIGCMHALCVRLVPPEAPHSSAARALALIPVTLFGLNPVWTHVASLAEVHSWHQVWVLAASLVYLNQMRAAGASTAEGGGGSTLRRVAVPAAVWGIVCGTGLAHHPTSVLFFVPLGVGLMAAHARRVPGTGQDLRDPHRVPGTGRDLRPAATFAGIAVLVSCVPLASYVSLYLKASHSDPAVWIRLEPGWASVWAHATAAQYHGYVGGFAALASQQRLLARYVFPYLALGLGLMILLAWRSRSGTERSLVPPLLAAVLFQTAFSFTYGVADPVSYFLPALAIGLAALVPLGASLAASGANPQRLFRLGTIGLAAATLLQVPVWVGVGKGRRDLLTTLDGRVRQMWQSIPFENGIVLWGGDLHHRMHAFQLLLGERPGLHLVSPYELVVPMSDARFAERFGFGLSGASRSARFTTPPTKRGPEYDGFLEDAARRLHDTTRQPVAVLSPSTDSIRVVGEMARKEALGSKL